MSRAWINARRALPLHFSFSEFVQSSWNEERQNHYTQHRRSIRSEATSPASPSYHSASGEKRNRVSGKKMAKYDTNIVIVHTLTIDGPNLVRESEVCRLLAAAAFSSQRFTASYDHGMESGSSSSRRGGRGGA